jgi:NAD+ kinase
MKLARVLVVFKETSLSRVMRDRSKSARKIRALLAHGDATVRALKIAHAEHLESVAEVRRVLARSGVQVIETARLPERPVKGYDLVVTVGGDGMVLGVSHAVRDGTPVLGVNSAPSSSVGYLTGCLASTFERAFGALREGRWQPLSVQRLSVRLGGRQLREPVLNDVLFCADNPAVVSRYRLIWPDGEELQRSSGVWISTPAGSTSALASAGGPTLPLTAKQFAFLVREPYAPPGMGVRVRSAVLAREETLTIECRMADASIFLDGSHRRYPVPFGQKVSFTLHQQPLQLLRAPHAR